MRDALRGPVAPWMAALAAGWLVCLPLLGPYGALVGLLPGWPSSTRPGRP